MRECFRCRGVRAVLEHKDRDTQDTELTGQFPQLIWIFFHAVTYKYQRTDGALSGSGQTEGMFEQSGDLRLSRSAADRGHPLLQDLGVGCPGGCLEFSITTVIGQLDFEATH